MSSVSPHTVFSANRPVDLNKLRDTILSSQRTGAALPAQTSRKVYATRDGKIVQGDDAQESTEQPLSEVHQGTFAAHTYSTYDREVVAMRLPDNARHAVVDGTAGWFYDFTNDLGDSYCMFVFFDEDSATYMVQVVFPEVAGKYGIHDGHLFNDGCICFGDSAPGMSSLDEAYGKSVLWSDGFSAFRRTGLFPFSKNNL